MIKKVTILEYMMEKSTINTSPHLGLISLWAVAECGIGGVMHAIKIPFTGIIVGSISAMCLYFIALNSTFKKQAIIEATATVMMIKLLASPHSPWQAYVAVGFQALMAIVLLSSPHISKTQAMTFTIITQVESALQRIGIMVLIFGTSFFEALNKSAKQLMSNLGIDTGNHLIWIIFGSYVFLHIMVGMVLGYWLPRLNTEVHKIQPQIYTSTWSSVEIKKGRKKFWIVTITSLCLPLMIAWFLDEKALAFIFFRVLCITIAFIFILTPLIKYLILKYASKANNTAQVNSIIDQLPSLISYYGKHIQWAHQNYSGIKKIKYTLLSLLHASKENRLL
jgi:hypothetical protein